mmetsp:Transcript_50651/g.104197  ORF Transcript_50651/g.104197 Transcript_50651/m.104197 type:complete len:294 (-) Transcript_50651:327-1208(-)
MLRLCRIVAEAIASLIASFLTTEERRPFARAVALATACCMRSAMSVAEKVFGAASPTSSSGVMFPATSKKPPSSQQASRLGLAYGLSSAGGTSTITVCSFLRRRSAAFAITSWIASESSSLFAPDSKSFANWSGSKSYMSSSSSCSGSSSESSFIANMVMPGCSAPSVCASSPDSDASAAAPPPSSSAYQSSSTRSTPRHCCKKLTRRPPLLLASPSANAAVCVLATRGVPGALASLLARAATFALSARGVLTAGASSSASAAASALAAQGGLTAPGEAPEAALPWRGVTWGV